MSNFDMYNFKDKDFFSKTRTIFLYGEVNMAMAYDIGCRIKYLD